MTAFIVRRALSRSFPLAILTLLVSAGLASHSEAQVRTTQGGIPGFDVSSQEQIQIIVSGSLEEIRVLAERYGAELTRELRQGGALTISPDQLEAISRDAAGHVSADAIVESTMSVSAASIGADQVWDGLGAAGSFTGAGIGVAVLDSGISDHVDLSGRVVAAVDLVDENGNGEDRYGHGTHVAGIVAGGSGSGGVAPGVHLINVRVLNEEGWGHASTVIAGIDWAIEHKDQYRIRILNLSLGAGVLESYRDDPLGQAVERAVNAGIVVVCSAGNFGKTEEGTPVIGGVTSPGNTPSALTVGAINTFGTAARSDDEVTSYSSRGPTAIDYVLKPDLVAPGNKVVSLQAPASYLATNYPERQVPGGYLKLSGTSMSAAVVSGAAALLLESNPELTPQQVKVALQSSASPVDGAGTRGSRSRKCKCHFRSLHGVDGPQVPSCQQPSLAANQCPPVGLCSSRVYWSLPVAVRTPRTYPSSQCC